MTDGKETGKNGGKKGGGRGELPLRERKKLRTRRALAETALELFSAKGFAAATLDELVEAVEVSKRTFFRTFASKEDVALAPERELWRAYVDDISERPFGGQPLLAVFEGSLYAAVASMDEGWERRFLTSRALADATPALNAHSLRHCAEVTDEVVALAVARLGAEPRTDITPLRVRLLLELMLSAWRGALKEWSAPGGEQGRAALVEGMDAAFGEIPALLELAAQEPVFRRVRA
ncbi:MULTISPECIES: TetR/AcrR family transcriptional regulator [unclassified Streptomyces]|uniref:TetR/AcrR family transcriptional regulator n=1 Tax=unclassified Streptomyces TaxID=2593676 RepID=UPI00332F6866